MGKCIALMLGFLTFSQAAFAQNLDGRYRPVGIVGESWDCKSVGQDGGALAIANGAFLGVESRCSMQNPTALRRLDATLFDLVCHGPVEAWTRRVIIMRTPNGIAMIENGGEVSYLARCE